MTPSPGAVLLALLTGLVGASGCSYPTDVTPYPGLCPEMYVAVWSPPDNASDVPTDVTVSVTFSDYPDPDTVGESTMLLTTGVFRVPERYRVDLASKSVFLTPNGMLSSNLGYTISVGQGVASLEGCRGMFAERQFTTGSTAANTPAPPIPALADVQAIFDAQCAGNCHADASSGCLPAPAGGLSLCADEARAALVDVPSLEVASLALVDPLDSARSYLMRKLLPATVGGGPIPGPLGEREPPGAPLLPDQLELIAAWIDGGALP